MLPNLSNPFLLTQGLYQNTFDSSALGVLKDAAFMSPESMNGHIYKANKLKMTKHAGFGANDLSQRFRSGIHLLSSQSNIHQGQHSKKRRIDCVSPYYCKNTLLAMPSHVTIMQPVLQANPFINQNFLNHLHSDNRSSSFAQPPVFNTLPRNNGFQQLSTSYDNFQLNSSSSGSPSFAGLMNPVPMTKNHPVSNAASKVSTTSNLKSHLRAGGNDGDYNIVVGEVLCSTAENYEVISFLGRGTFGQVVKCQCRHSNRIVAIKILKNHPSYLRQGNVEVQILQTLSQHDTEMHNIVRAIECFQHRNHMCLVFELLEQNLYEFLKSNNFRPLDLHEIRPIAQQVLTALSKLRNLGLIHADLKPENIMLVCPTDGVMRYRVKVIDFGSACHSSNAIQNTYLQSRYYRAPEILIGLPFNEAIDMWSLGCVIAELFLGWPLYPGSSEYDQIRYIVETQGLPPRDLLKMAGKASRFFVHDTFTFEWRIKTQEEYTLETGQRAKETRKYIFSSLDHIREAMPNTSSSGVSIDEIDVKLESEDRMHFTELLSQMLQLRPSDRILPDNALLHNFISMSYMRAYPYRKQVQESMNLMRVCYKPYCNQQSLEMATVVQKQQEQAMLDETRATQAVNAFAAQQHLLAFGSYLEPTSSGNHGCHDHQLPASMYCLAPQQPAPSPIYCHHEQQQQCIRRPQPPPPPLNYKASSIYDQLIVTGSPYAAAVAHATAPTPQQARNHQNAAAAAAALMQSAIMAANGNSSAKPSLRSGSSAGNGDHAMAAKALAVALAASSYSNKAVGVRGQQYVLPSNRQVTQQFSGIESAKGVNHQSIDCLMNYMPGVVPDSTGCTSIAHTPQRHPRCRPENDMALFLLSSSSTASVVPQNLSYNTPHQYLSNHLPSVAPISLISPQKPHVQMQMRTQQQRQQHRDAANSSTAAAATASSLATLRQLLLSSNSQTGPNTADQLIWESILHEHQRKSSFSTKPDLSFLPAELRSQLIQLGKNDLECCYDQKCQFLHCGGHQHYHHHPHKQNQAPTHPLQASPLTPLAPSPQLRPSSQQQLTGFLQGLASSQPRLYTTSARLPHTAPERTHDAVQAAVNVAHHIFPLNCQRSASSSSSPRAENGGDEVDALEVVNMTSNFTECPSDGNEVDGPNASVFRSPASPIFGILEMPVLAQSSPSTICPSSNSGERLGPPQVMGATNAEVGIVFSDVTNECKSNESSGDIHTTEVQKTGVSAKNRSFHSPFDNTEAFYQQFNSTQVPASLIHRPDKKIPVGRVHPMKKAECDDSACFAQPKAPSFNYCYTQPQAHTLVPACSNASVCCSAAAFAPESSGSVASSTAAFLFNNAHTQPHPAVFSAPAYLHNQYLHLQQQQQLATVEAYRNLILLQQHINLSAAAAQFIAAAVAGVPSSQLNPVLPFANPASGGVGPGGNHSLEQLTAQLMAAAAAAAVSSASANNNNNSDANTDLSHYL